MKVIVRSATEGGHSTRFEVDGIAEALNIANVLTNPVGFAVRCQDGSPGTSRWRYSKLNPLIIVGQNQIIFEFKTERVDIDAKVLDLKGYGE